jgi:hypothetical protein
MKIEIVSTVKRRSGNSNGRDWEIFEQDAYLHTDGKKYPEEMKIQVPSEREAYAIGFYEFKLDSSNFYISRYGQLTLARELILMPIQGDLKKVG